MLEKDVTVNEGQNYLYVEGRCFISTKSFSRALRAKKILDVINSSEWRNRFSQGDKFCEKILKAFTHQMTFSPLFYAIHPLFVKIDRSRVQITFFSFKYAIFLSVVELIFAKILINLTDVGLRVVSHVLICVHASCSLS